MMLGLLLLGLSIPHAGRPLVTALAMLNLFWQAGIGLLVAGTILIGLSWLNSR
jgi:hypothetical protein